MKIVALSCPQCGGSQDIADDQRIVECRYCRTKLRLERSKTGELNRLLIEAQQENADLSAENQKLELENAIHRLDNEWTERRNRLLVRTKRGTREPSTAWGYIAFSIGAVLILAWFVAILTNEMPTEARIVIFIVGCFFVIGGLSERNAGGRFKRERNAYENQRSVFQKQLAVLEHAASHQPSYEDTKSRRQRLDRMSYPAADA